MPAVDVIEILAKAGDLDPPAALLDEDDAELLADLARATEQSDHSIGLGISGHVVVGGSPAQHHVTHTPAREQRDVTVLVQTTNDVQTRHWIPDLLDGWDQPIIYVGSMRARGTLVKDPAVPNGRPQYSRESMFPYLESVLLGDAGANQAELSILSDAVATEVEADKNFAQILRNPGFGEPDEPLRGQARGRYLIMSAGEDNIFFSKTDGPGSIGATVTRINDDPGFVKQYDDIVRAGGG